MKPTLTFLAIIALGVLLSYGLGACGKDDQGEFIDPPAMPQAYQVDIVQEIGKFRGEMNILYYIHDPTRKVGIWYIRTGYGPSISVLPDESYR